MKKQYVNPQVISEEVKRLNSIAKYSNNVSEAYRYFDDLSEEDDKKVDQLTMDDFKSATAPEGGAPPAGGAPPQGGAPAPPEGGAGALPPEGAAPEGGAPEGGDVQPPENPFGGAGAQPEAGAPPAGEPTEEVDVTDIVQGTKDVQQKTDEMGGKVDSTMQKVDALLAKIDAMEANIGKMDQALTKIDGIYKEIELMKPPSPEEVKQVMAQNSYPFNVPLSDYGKEGTPENQTDLEKKKHKLSLSNLLSDFSEKDVRQSFNPPDPFADKLAQTLPSYRI